MVYLGGRNIRRLSDVELAKRTSFLKDPTPSALAGGVFLFAGLFFANLEGCDVGGQDAADFSSASSTKPVRRVPSWMWLITSGAIPVVMLAMKLTFCWAVYTRKGDSQALAVAAAVIAPGWRALSRHHRSHRAGRNQSASISSTAKVRSKSRYDGDAAAELSPAVKRIGRVKRASRR